jgi:hypothetical protein
MNGDSKNSRSRAGDELGQLRERFEQWRQQKRDRRQRIPSALWDAAAGLASWTMLTSPYYHLRSSNIGLRVIE